ncbi:MAG: chromosome segregation SMC family protein [Candidatus Caldarchaeum sp.]
MVRIKAVAIQGFKSFGSKKTTIKLPPGLVVITGPNGGGKSTVLDAVKFALGELSAHNLRADRFSKLLHESAKGQDQHASVSLTLDNQGHAIPVDSDEVVLTRRLSSSGESEYLVNGRSVSRNEMLTLLSTANIKPDGLNLVTQGSVVGIAEMNSRELRQMLEDAAGISGYKKRRDDALKELETAQRNLDVAKAATSEVRNRVKQLELERNQFLRKTMLDRELARLRSASIVNEINNVRQQLVQLEKHAEEVLKTLETKQALKQEAEERASKARAEYETLQRLRGEQGSSIRSLQSLIYDKQAEKSRLEAELRSYKSSLEQLAEQSRMLVERMQRWRERLVELQARLEEKAGEAEQAAQSYKAFETQLSEARRHVDAVRERVEEVEDAYASKLNEVRYLKLSEDGRSLVLENLERQLQSRRREKDEVLKTVEENIRRKEALAAEIQKNREAETALATTLADLEKQSSILAEEAARISGKIAEVDKLLEEADFLKASLESLGETVRRGERKGQEGGSAMTVGEFFGGKLSPFTAAALGDWVNALMVEDLENALELAAKSVELGIPLKIVPLSQTGYDVEKILQAVTGAPAPKQVESAKNLTPDDGNTATRDGVYVGPNLLVSVWVSRVDRVSVFVESSVEKLERLRAKLAGKRSQLETKLHKLRESVNQARARMEEVRRQLNEKQLATAKLEASLSSLDKQLDNGKARLSTLERSIESLESEAENLRSMLAEKSGELAELVRLRAELDNLRREARIAEENMRRASAEATSLYKKQLNIERELDGIVVESRNIAERLENAEKELELLKTREQKLSSDAENAKTRLDMVEVELNRLKSERDEADRMLAEVEQRLSEKAQELREVEANVDRLRDEISTLERENNTVMVERVRLETSLQALNERLRMVSSVEDEVLPTLPAELLPSLEEEAKEVAVVNQLAVMQYDSIISNYKLRSSRINELEMERRRILDFIESINREEVEAFNKALERVSESFNFYFNQLTGGEGYLRLENPQDPLNSGVEMVVRFVGKQPRSTSSVSGGEKSVSAVALILALQDLTPAQFYIFDEIDAHLDVVYVKNLVSLMKKMSSKKQIIIITLKDIIAEQADALYGVYMVNEASQVVKTKLSEVVEAG